MRQTFETLLQFPLNGAGTFRVGNIFQKVGMGYERFDCTYSKDIAA
jgi:hypothetical protein